ncbi:hypothetical protein P3T27_004568 [Kitasatospora sp. MAA19]|uniref:hypothetical protein n=1 Tax=Kitasatospora sp. MAA19 TaxID=3035090 RepID=UPI002474A956|nr:hypothetical protein [Kitasatospora sp. MAA19]MDH6707831.1 hypothetical protein [Kitasatospora sp. MAA19]
MSGQEPPRSGYQVTAADLGRLMAEYREVAERADRAPPTRAEVLAYVVAGLLCMAALGWRLPH